MLIKKNNSKIQKTNNNNVDNKHNSKTMVKQNNGKHKIIIKIMLIKQKIVKY